MPQGRSITAKVDLDLKPFQSRLSEMKLLLNQLSEGVNIDFTGSKLKYQMNDLKTIISGVSAEAEKITTAFNNIQGLSSFLENLQAVKTKLETIQGDVDKINQGILKSGESSTKLASEEERLSALEKQRLANQRKFASELAKQGREHMKIAREQNRQLTYYEKQQLELQRSNAELTKYWEMQERIAWANAQDMAVLEGKATSIKSILQWEGEELAIQEEINLLLKQGSAESIAQAEATIKQLNEKSELFAILEEEIALEKQKLGLIEEENAMLNEQGAVRKKNAVTGAKGNQLDKMGYLPSRIGSMAVTMWGFNEIMDIYEKSMQNMNALGQQKAYTDLMKTDNRYLEQTNQNVSDITSGIAKMNKAINETYKGGMSLQKMYQKVDMQSVGANAMDSAFKYGVQADKLDELTEVMAIYGSEFVRQGRSQEDSILAVNDALDGEYRRLKEVNIGKEELEAHGYEEGDTVSMIEALREIAQERGYDVVAQKITNLSDAITVLEIRIAQDLVGAFKVLEPILTEVANDFIYMLDTFEWAFNGVRDVWNKFTTELDKKFGVQNMQKYGGGLLKLIGWAITLGITFGVVYKVVKGLRGALSSIFSIFGKGTDEIAKTTGDIAKTGGTAPTKGGNWKNGVKNWGKNLAKNLGKMAEIFIEVAVAIAMAWALLKEAMFLIADLGKQWNEQKEEFNSGIEFIKEYGIWIIGVSAILGYWFSTMSNTPVQTSNYVNMAKNFGKVALGLALAMGLITEAILLLNAPLLAIASIGAVQSWQKDNIETGIATIQMFADALNYIVSDGTIGWFIVGFIAISGILGFTADVVAIPMVIGIATSLLLVAEAIAMLVVPLGAIALLGGTASALGEENINKGAETIRMIGSVLQVLAQAIPYLLVVDLTIFGVQLVEWGNRLLSGGKDGLTTLVQDILPTIQSFITDFNQLEFSETLDTTKITTITTVASQLPPLFTAIQDLNNAMGTSDAVGNIGGALGGSISGAIGMGLKGKLDQLYNDVKDVMDFASKIGGATGGNGANASAVTQTANAITQLKAKMDTLVATIMVSSTRVRNASKGLGSAIKLGFAEGSNGFNTSVVSVVAGGIREVQSRYTTWKSGGEASAQKLAEGFEKISEKFKSSISEEMGYALAELDNYKDDFYNKGAMLGQSLVDGFKSKKALDQNSPAKITKSIVEEMQYSMIALDNGRQMMYQGGQALGQALVNGYNSGGNLRTNVDVLASKGVNNQQLQANARNVQVNAKKNQQVPQSFNPTINIDMSNSTVIGVQDLDERIRSGVEKALIQFNSPSGARGY